MDEMIDYDEYRFFYLPKEMVKNGMWASLSKGLKAVLPVLHRYADKNGYCFPSQNTIAINSGVSLSVVKRCMRELNMLDGYSINIKKGKTHRYNTYQLPVYRGGNMIKVRADFIDDCWGGMSPSSKAVYISLLANFAYFDNAYLINTYFDDSGFEDKGTFVREHFPNRKWETIEDLSKNKLSELSGISRSTVNNALDGLRKANLILDHPIKDSEIIKLTLKME